MSLMAQALTRHWTLIVDFPTSRFVKNKFVYKLLSVRFLSLQQHERIKMIIFLTYKETIIF
jgi:predicted metallopeptidase